MLQTKAIYNLIRLNAAEDPSVKAEPWALEDLRILPIEKLFSRLGQFHVNLDRISFRGFAESYDTPEELTELLFPDTADEDKRDPFYLLIFELWRRILPEKQSLSIFCDELDHRIFLYDKEAIESDEPIQDALANLLEVLDENTDAGAKPQEVFSAVSDFCAHDIESFIYDYISDLFESENSLYASELIEGFSPYVLDPIWFDFLKIRLLAATDISDANAAISSLLKNELELPLLVEILQFLIPNGEPEFFSLALKKALPLLSTEEDLREILKLVTEFYRRLDEEDQERAVQKMIDERKDPSGVFDLADPALQLLQSLVSNSSK